MIRLIRSRRRLAALASTALAAGTVSVLPAVVGLSTASAAGTDYSCHVVTTGTGAKDESFPAQLAYTVAAPESVTVGQKFTPTATAKLTFGQAFRDWIKTGPIKTVGAVGNATTAIAGTAGTAATTFTPWQRTYTGTNPIGQPIDSIVLDGTVALPEVTPAAPGPLAVDVSGLTGTLSLTVTFGNVTSTGTLDCTPVEGTAPGSATVTVVEAPEQLSYSCHVVTTGTGAKDDSFPADLAYTVTAPETVTVGEKFTPTAAAKLTFGKKFRDWIKTGPIKTVGAVGNATTAIAGTAGTAATTFTPWQRTYTGTNPIGQPIESMVLDGTVALPEVTPAAAGPLAIDVSGLTGTVSMTVTFGNVTSTGTLDCTPAEGTEPGSATVTVTEAPDPEPTYDGLAYACDYNGWLFPAYIDTTVTLPESVKQGQALNPALTSKVTWVDNQAALAWPQQHNPTGDWRSWPATSRNLSASYKDGTGTLATMTGDAAGKATFGFASLPVSETGDMVWDATGTYGAVNTATAGATTLNAGDITLSMQAKNSFTNGAYVPAEIACELVDGQDAELGSVVVQEVPQIAVAKAAAVTGTARVGSTLSASAAFDPADAVKTYQWLRNGAAIAGATRATYAAAPADLGRSLSVRITATKADYQTVTSTSPAVKVAAGVQKVTGKAKISGAPKVGKTLKVVPGKSAGARVTYQWLVNGKAVKGATKATMKATKKLAKKKVSVKVTYTRAGYGTVTQVTPAVKIKKK